MISSSLRTGCPLLDRFLLLYHDLSVIHKEVEGDYGLLWSMTLDTLKNQQYLLAISLLKLEWHDLAWLLPRPLSSAESSSFPQVHTCHSSGGKNKFRCKKGDLYCQNQTLAGLSIMYNLRCDWIVNNGSMRSDHEWRYLFKPAKGTCICGIILLDSGPENLFTIKDWFFKQTKCSCYKRHTKTQTILWYTLNPKIPPNSESA